MMAGNPNWWSMNGMHLQSQSQPFVYGASTSPTSSPPSDLNHHPSQDFPARSWSQLLLGGLGGGEEERYGGGGGGGGTLFQHQKKAEDDWEDQVLNLNQNFTGINNNPVADVVKQELSQSQTQSTHEIDYVGADDEQLHPWPRHHHQTAGIPVSSPTSCVTTLSNNNNVLNFSGATASASAAAQRKNHQHNQDHSSECNSTVTGGASKKARVQQSTAQPALKVRKEKLGDRITALHQLVSPFGKTDTASVLSEAIGYIRFLQGQIEALSSPYMRDAGGNTVHHQHSVQERNCLFPEEPSQFLNDIAMEGRGASKLQDSQSRSGSGDLRSRGLCLVPISCTQHIGNENGADYWAPAAFGGGGF